MEWILDRLFKQGGLKEIEAAEKALRTRISRENCPKKQRQLHDELAELLKFKNTKKNELQD